MNQPGEKSEWETETELAGVGRVRVYFTGMFNVGLEFHAARVFSIDLVERVAPGSPADGELLTITDAQFMKLFAAADAELRRFRDYHINP